MALLARLQAREGAAALVGSRHRTLVAVVRAVRRASCGGEVLHRRRFAVLAGGLGAVVRAGGCDGVGQLRTVALGRLGAALRVLQAGSHAVDVV